MGIQHEQFTHHAHFTALTLITPGLQHKTRGAEGEEEGLEGLLDADYMLKMSVTEESAKCRV